MEREPQGYVPTTTHAEWGAGEPHLLISRHGEDRTVFPLVGDTTNIGSDAGCALVLDGAEPLHATITHDERDEYVLTMHGSGRMNASAPEGEKSDPSEILRTGAQFTIGDWLLVFGRAEFADHGRPFGGREGGEGTAQPQQPARPDYPTTGEQPPHEAERS